jgi:hypothetical protein
MNVLLKGLGQSPALKHLDVQNSQTDKAGFVLLGQAFAEITNMPLEHIILPKCSLDDDTGLSTTDFKDFVRCIARVPRQLKTVDVKHYMIMKKIRMILKTA